MWQVLEDQSALITLLSEAYESACKESKEQPVDYIDEYDFTLEELCAQEDGKGKVLCAFASSLPSIHLLGCIQSIAHIIAESKDPLKTAKQLQLPCNMTTEGLNADVSAHSENEVDKVEENEGVRPPENDEEASYKYMFQQMIEATDDVGAMADNIENFRDCLFARMAIFYPDFLKGYELDTNDYSVEIDLCKRTLPSLFSDEEKESVAIDMLTQQEFLDDALAKAVSNPWPQILEDNIQPNQDQIEALLIELGFIENTRGKEDDGQSAPEGPS